MAMAVTSTKGGSGGSSSPAPAYHVAKPPGFIGNKTTTAAAGWTTTRPPADDEGQLQGRRLELEPEGVVLALRAAAALMAFVGVALVASCRHGDWMEFARYHEYRYLLGASVVACVYSAAQALRRITASSSGRLALVDFAGDQAVAYLLITAASAALPITIRMRSAVINIFTDAMVAAICLAFVAFAALAFSAMLAGFRISANAAAQPY